MSIKQQIITLIGKHGTTPVVLDNNTLETEALYVFHNDVFCLKDGEDFPFDDIKDQSSILKEIQSNAYTLDPTFQ